MPQGQMEQLLLQETKKSPKRKMKRKRKRA
jgi:hypothetical protein